MLQSHLRRDKWEREDYLPRTIRHAVSQQTEVYDRNYRNKPQGADLVPVNQAGGLPVPYTHFGMLNKDDKLEEVDIAIQLADAPNCRELVCYDVNRQQWVHALP